MAEAVLDPVVETYNDFIKLEIYIGSLFKRELYLPLIRILSLPKDTLSNAAFDALIGAIESGRIGYDRGRFTGKFSAATTKALKDIGAVWKDDAFRIHFNKLPVQVRDAIDVSIRKFEMTAARMDAKLTQILPEKIADQLKMEHIFDRTIWKVDESFKKVTRGLIVPPELTPERRKLISVQYTHDMQRYIKDWTEREIVTLRRIVQKETWKGFRYERLVSTIQHRYGVSQNKAKFLARQETSLLMTKFTESRYTDAGSEEYIWECVKGSPLHPVRPMHKALDGKRFRWDNKPVTSPNGDRNHPGEDYGCRCRARAIVKF